MFTEICRRNALVLAQAYGAATGNAPTTVSMRFYGNGTFFRELQKRKRSISVDRFGLMLADFARNWPKGTRWPPLEEIHFTQENLVQQNYVSEIRSKHHA
jgi:hypothetical protein